MNKKWKCKVCGQEWQKPKCLNCDITQEQNNLFYICTNPKCRQLNERSNPKCTNCGWRTRKAVKTQDLMSRGEIVNMLENIMANSKPDALGINHDVMHCALIALTYLTASRISEICMTIRKRNIVYDKIKGHNFVIITELPTKKRRKGSEPQPRSCPINIDEEAEIWAFVELYIADLKPNSILFPIKPKCANVTFNRKTKKSPHYFRHLRMTHLVQYYGMDAIGLKNYVNWANIETSSWYLHLGWQDMASKLIRKE